MNPHTIRKQQGMKFPVLWLYFVSVFVREGDMPRMGLSDPFAYDLALRCKSCKNKNKIKTCSRQLLNLVLAGLISWSMISLSYTAVVIHPL